MTLSNVYRRSSAEFVEVVQGLTADQATTTVRACPAWTVHDLLAHLAASSSDLLSGNVDGITTDPWTARQVEERRTRSVDQLLAEWASNAEAVAVACDSIEGPNPAWDVVVHLADLRESVDLPPGPADHGWGEVLVAAVGLLADGRGATVSIAQCEADPGDTTWHFATAYGLWRALFGRLDRPTLAAEVRRGDVDAFAAAAFFAS